MRRFRKFIDVLVPVTGAVIVFLAVILIPDFNLQARIATVLVGILLIEAGVWKLTSPFLPSERKFVGLREEVDRFILQVRALNDAALQDPASEDGTPSRRMQGVLDAMHQSVDHMADLAGKTGG